MFPFDSNIRYISKILEGNTDDSLLIDEISISNRIMNIPNYQYYFAPILETCLIDISIIPESEREKCPTTAKYLTKSETVIGEDSDSEVKNDFTSSAMKYVGKKAIRKYLLEMIKYNETSGVISTYKTYTHLLQGIINMQNMTSSIIHFDLKLDNVLIDEKLNVPIIIDFGFAVTNTELLNIKNYEETLDYRFWSYQYESGEFVINWSIEVELLCYISQIKLKSRGGKINDIINFIDIEHLGKVVENYIDKTNMKIAYSLTDEDISSFYHDTRNYIASYQLFTWKILVDNLVRTYESWDVYSLAVIYSLIMNDDRIQSEKYCNNSFIQNLNNDIIDIIISGPGKRSNPMDILSSTMRHWKKFQTRME